MSTSSRSSAVASYELAHNARPSAVDQSAAQQQFSYLAYAREDAPHANFSGSSNMAQVGHSSSNIDLHQDSNGSSYTGNQQQMLHGAGGSGSSMSSSARRLREFIPEHKKDHEYWLKRQKNNEAAKRSREKRRINDIVMGRKIFELSNENKRLRLELEAIKRHFGLPVNMPYPIGDLASLQNNQPDSPSLVNVSSSDDSSPSLSSFVHTPVGYSALSPLPSMSELRGGIIQETGNVTLTPSLETNQPERMLINSGESLSRSQIYSQQQQQQQQQLQQQLQQQHHVQSLWQHRQQQQGQQHQQHLRSNRTMSLDGIRPGNSGDSDPGIMLGGAPLHSGTPVTHNSTSTTFPYKKSLQGVSTQGVPLHNNRLHDIPCSPQMTSAMNSMNRTERVYPIKQEVEPPNASSYGQMVSSDRHRNNYESYNRVALNSTPQTHQAYGSSLSGFSKDAPLTLSDVSSDDEDEEDLYSRYASLRYKDGPLNLSRKMAASTHKLSLQGQRRYSNPLSLQSGLRPTVEEAMDRRNLSQPSPSTSRFAAQSEHSTTSSKSVAPESLGFGTRMLPELVQSRAYPTSVNSLPPLLAISKMPAPKSHSTVLLSRSASTRSVQSPDSDFNSDNNLPDCIADINPVIDAALKENSNPPIPVRNNVKDMMVSKDQILPNRHVRGGVPLKVWHKLSLQSAAVTEKNLSFDVDMPTDCDAVESGVAEDCWDRSYTISEPVPAPLVERSLSCSPAAASDSAVNYSFSPEQNGGMHLELRRRNNLSSRKCRRNRKLLNEMHRMAAMILENDNFKLRDDLQVLSSEVSNLKEYVVKAAKDEHNGKFE